MLGISAQACALQRGAESGIRSSHEARLDPRCRWHCTSVNSTLRATWRRLQALPLPPGLRDSRRAHRQEVPRAPQGDGRGTGRRGDGETVEYGARVGSAGAFGFRSCASSAKVCHVSHAHIFAYMVQGGALCPPGGMLSALRGRGLRLASTLRWLPPSKKVDWRFGVMVTPENEEKACLAFPRARMWRRTHAQVCHNQDLAVHGFDTLRHRSRSGAVDLLDARLVQRSPQVQRA